MTELNNDQIDTSVPRITASDKRIINGATDVNQLVPFRHKWAWSMYLSQCEKHWMPQELPALHWAGRTAGDKDKSLHSLAMLDTMSRSRLYQTTLATYRHITSPEARQYLLRMSFEQATHLHLVSHLSELIGTEIPNYDDYTHVVEYNEFLRLHQDYLLDPTSHTRGVSGQQFIMAYVADQLIGRGIFYYVELLDTPLLPQYTKMFGDFKSHCEFASNVINTIKTEEPAMWTDHLKNELAVMFKQATEMMLHQHKLRGQQWLDFVKRLVNKRLNDIGIGNLYPVQPEEPMVEIAALVGLPALNTKVVAAASVSDIGSALDWD